MEYSKRGKGVLQAPASKLLKNDLFGQVRLEDSGAGPVVVRDASEAAAGLRWAARWMLAREAAALAALDGVDGVPQVMHASRERIERSYLEGEPMQVGRPRDSEYFRRAARLLRRLHRQGVVHNDLAKEPNLLLMPGGKPGFIDFQLAWHARRRGRLFRLLGREDIRHLLKHKRTYCAHALTEREKRILDNPSLLSRAWKKTGKRIYLFITRRVLGWADREGAGDRP